MNRIKLIIIIIFVVVIIGIVTFGVLKYSRIIDINNTLSMFIKETNNTSNIKIQRVMHGSEVGKAFKFESNKFPVFFDILKQHGEKINKGVLEFIFSISVVFNGKDCRARFDFVVGLNSACIVYNIGKERGIVTLDDSGLKKMYRLLELPLLLAELEEQEKYIADDEVDEKVNQL